MAENDGGPAFPLANQYGVVNGMSLRDYFAAKAMPQVIAHIMEVRATMIKPGQFNFNEVGDTAYQVADAMLRARAATSNPSPTESYFKGHTADAPHPHMPATGTEGRCELCGQGRDAAVHAWVKECGQ